MSLRKSNFGNANTREAGENPAWVLNDTLQVDERPCSFQSWLLNSLGVFEM